MMAALHEDLRAAEVERFLDFLVDLIVSDDVGIVILLNAIEGAEFAIDIANIRVVDIAVNDVGGDFVAAPIEVSGLGELAAAVGQGAEFLQRQVIKTEGLGAVDAFSIPNPLQKIIE